jgi:hypothetical protein
MRTRVPNEKPATPAPGEIHTKRLRMLAAVKAEIINEAGKHVMQELAAGELVTAPVWSANDLLGRRMAELAEMPPRK